jgi:2-oxoglutarate ferredoxin oxidoreductase subunit beta
LGAFQKAIEKERLPLGIFYRNPGKPTFEENVGLYKQDKTPLSLRETERGERLMNLISSKK